jgi:cell division septal protein FtsQ
MAGKKKREPVERTPRERENWRVGVRRWLRFALWTFGSAATVFAAAAALLEGEQFFNHDARFRLSERGPRAEDDSITVTGLKHASLADVLHVFDGDRGRGLISLDAEARRQALRRVDWVRDASVRRIWPNRVRVEIQEREPVALIQVPTGFTGDSVEPLRYSARLIDADGVILPARGELPRGLVLLGGVREQDDIERRRARVMLMLRVLDELGSSRQRVAETDLSDPENVRLTLRMPDRQVTLLIGNEHFRERVATFERHYDGIRTQVAAYPVLDVSMEGRITGVGGAAERSR